jgi:hypothetical protein
MISVRTALRVMPAAWFGVPLAILAAWYASLLHSAPGYGLAATGLASGTMPFIGAFVAASSAWEAGRLRRARIWGGPWVRGGLRIAAGLVTVPIIAGVLATLTASGVSLAQAAAFPPDLVILAVLVLDVLVWASIGFTLGIRTPTALAVPTAAILPILWLAFVPAMYPVWLRHLTGMYRDCCALDEGLAGQAVLASVAMDLAFLAAALILASRWDPRGRAIGALAVVLVAAIVGAQAASSLGFAPVAPRDPSLLSCASVSGADICLWPEHVASAGLIQTTVADVRQRWLAADIDAPSRYSESSSETSSGTLAFHPIDPLTRDGVIMAMADGMLPRIPCGAYGTTGGVALGYLEAWYAAAGGLTAASLGSLDAPGHDNNPSILSAVDALTQASPSVRRAWVARAVAISQSCEDIVPDLRVIQ